MDVDDLSLHASRYRTQPCNDGPACSRRVCFFAHTLDELRVPSEDTENYAPVVSPLEESSASSDVADPLTSANDIEQLIHDASCDLPMHLPRSHALLGHISARGEGRASPALPALHMDAAAGISVSSQHAYTVSSLTSSLLSHLPEPDVFEHEDLAEKPHYIEKSLTDLLNYENEAPLQRSPLSTFNLQNYDTSALESGLHWNGGPPRLFVDRTRSLSNSFGRSLVGSYSSDIENLSHEFLESAVISKSSKPFLLASQACNF